MTEPNNQTDTQTTPPVQYATFNARILAVTVDLFILMPFVIPIINWITNIIYGPMDMEGISNMLSQPEILQNPGKAVPIILDAASKYHLLARAMLENSLQIASIAAYTLPFWFRYSSTPGKMLLRLEILDSNTMMRMTRKQSVERFLGYIASFIPLTLGFIWIVFNKKRQGFHDKMAHTLVVVKQKKTAK